MTLSQLAAETVQLATSMGQECADLRATITTLTARVAELEEGGGGGGGGSTILVTDDVLRASVSGNTYYWPASQTSP